MTLSKLLRSALFGIGVIIWVIIASLIVVMAMPATYLKNGKLDESADTIVIVIGDGIVYIAHVLKLY